MTCLAEQGLEGGSPSQKRPKLMLAFNTSLLQVTPSASGKTGLKSNRREPKTKEATASDRQVFTASLADVQKWTVNMMYLHTEIRGVLLGETLATRF